MSLIRGTMRFRYILEGEAPAGASEQEVQALVLSGVSVVATLMPFCRNSTVQVAPDIPGSQPSGPKII